jgi:DALR anticodon binding domain
MLLAGPADAPHLQLIRRSTLAHQLCVVICTLCCGPAARASTLCHRILTHAELARASTIKLTHESERPLALHIVRFPEVLEIAISELAPHRLTEYLYELSEVFNSFYRDCKVCHICMPNPRMCRLPHCPMLLTQYVHVVSGRRSAALLLRYCTDCRWWTRQRRTAGCCYAKQQQS